MTPALPELPAAMGPSLGSMAEEGCPAWTPRCSAGTQGEAQCHALQGGGPGPAAPTRSPMTEVTLPCVSPCHTRKGHARLGPGGLCQSPGPAAPSLLSPPASAAQPSKRAFSSSPH